MPVWKVGTKEQFRKGSVSIIVLKNSGKVSRNAMLKSVFNIIYKNTRTTKILQS